MQPTSRLENLETELFSRRHDATSDQQWRDVVARVEREQGQLSILVNNAGIVGTYEGIETVLSR